ncbi:poly-beta-1,6 N-acetyl-D-glucosamine export porin PgaA [Pseudomonas sp.]|uniref:poly-beta-1,6 N-acetyl-D-glucosamine export porin PgaA n=1 Tax=Pseudomonas sp. TaxID=306 RepID=UPI00272AEDF5|nr:poly-beta-1,6 N-acetyl-D-glucosamine export porin PgaA [Pseudomonas sp.]
MLAAVVAALLSSVTQAEAVGDQVLYSSLIEMARRGDHTPALAYLRSLSSPSLQEQADHILIASWAGLDREVLRLGADAPPSLRADPLIVAAMARAHRNLQQWFPALEKYRSLLARSPGQADIRLAYVMTLADSGEVASAVEEARAWIRESDSADARLASGYSEMRAGRRFAALHEFDAAKGWSPERADVLREYITALQRAGLSGNALALAQATPGIVDLAVLRSLQGDEVAELVRLADLEAREESSRFAIADKALSAADELITAWAETPEAQLDLVRVRIDRLGALYVRARMEELVEEYRQLGKQGITLPPYAQRWVAGALLYTREPEEAVQLYRSVIAAGNDQDPDWMADHQGLFFALMEAEQRQAAHDLAIQLAAGQPSRRYPEGVSGGLPNPDWERAQSLLATSYFFMDDTVRAQAAMEALSDAAPNNSWLRMDRAALYRARGWARRSEQELKVVENSQPHGLGVIVGQGETALALQEWRQLEELADAAISRYPENLGARRLDRLRRVQRMSEIELTGYRGRSDGDSVGGTGDFGLETVYRTPPVHHDWRGVAGLGYGRGDFIEGSGSHTWLRAGFERRVRDHALDGELSTHDYGHGTRFGARVAASWDFNDYWRYGGSAELLSSSTPLRALNSDVDADGASVFLRWRGSERREWQLSLSPLWFSDGNRRFTGSLVGRERLRTTHSSTLDLTMEASTSRNTQGGEGFYFNPKKDTSGLARLDFSKILRRHYDMTWSHSVQLGAGVYQQEGFGTSGMGLLGYSHRVRLHDQFGAGAGISLFNRQYDGERESNYRLVFDLQYRF